MRRRLICTATAALLAATVFPPPASAVSRPRALARALDFLHARQFANGGLGERGKGSSEQLTAWAIVAIAAAGENPNTWRRGPNSPVTFLSRSSSRWRTTTDYARTVLAAAAAGKNPRSFGGVDLIAKIQADVHADGSRGDRIGGAINSHTWGMIALRAAGEAVTNDQVRWLKGQQNADGGWGWAPSAASDTNDTAAVIEALVAAGESSNSSVIHSAVSYLRARQRSDGGFGYASGASDTASTSWVAQALVAAREGVTGRAWRKGRSNPINRLCAFQSLNGSMRYTASSEQNPLFMTVQAIPALALRAFPIPHSASMRSASRAGPAFSRLRPSPNSSLPEGSPVEIRFTIDDAQGTGVVGGNVQVRVDGASKTTRVSGVAVAADAGTLDEGKHSVTVQATDRAGNTSTMSGWHFAVGPGSEYVPTDPALDPEGGGTSSSTTSSPSLTATSTGEGGIATGTVPAPEVESQPSDQSKQGSIDKWSDAVDVEPGSAKARTPLLNQIGMWALIVLAFFVPTVGALALISWFSKRRARKKAAKKKRAEAEAGQTAAPVVTGTQIASPAGLSAAVGSSAQQPPTVLSQPGVPQPYAQQPPAPEAQQPPPPPAGQPPAQEAQQTPPAPAQPAAPRADGLTDDQEAAWNVWQSQQAEGPAQAPTWPPQQEQSVPSWPPQEPGAQQAPSWPPESPEPQSEQPSESPELPSDQPSESPEPPSDSEPPEGSR